MIFKGVHFLFKSLVLAIYMPLYKIRANMFVKTVIYEIIEKMEKVE